MNNSLYRPNVGIVLVNHEKKVFVGKRYDNKDDLEQNIYWQMPQGGIDEGETPQKAALRELLEEIGTDKTIIIKESTEWYAYDFPPELRYKLWGGAYIGQKQKWFLMQFTGRDADINLNTHNPEFCAMQWVIPEQAIDLIVPFKRGLYQQVFEEFNDYFP